MLDCCENQSASKYFFFWKLQSNHFMKHQSTSLSGLYLSFFLLSFFLLQSERFYYPNSTKTKNNFIKHFVQKKIIILRFIFKYFSQKFKSLQVFLRVVSFTDILMYKIGKKHGAACFHHYFFSSGL